MQFLDFDDQHRVRVYHTHPHLSGTPEFECGDWVDLTQAQHGTKLDGSDDPDVLVITCPTCGARSWVPILGGEDAQELHARVRHAQGKQLTLDAARATVAADVTSRGGIVRLPGAPAPDIKAKGPGRA